MSTYWLQKRPSVLSSSTENSTSTADRCVNGVAHADQHSEFAQPVPSWNPRIGPPELQRDPGLVGLRAHVRRSADVRRIFEATTVLVVEVAPLRMLPVGYIWRGVIARFLSCWDQTRKRHTPCTGRLLTSGNRV